jgi:hypothetical protein
LKTVFLNHSGSPAKLHSDLSSIDLLTTKEAGKGFIYYCRTHPLVKEVVLIPRFRRTKLIVHFYDGSELHFKLIRHMVMQSLNCLPNADIIQNASVNEYGMLIPSNYHHYEYILLKNQFSGTAFPDKFQKYFSALDFGKRTEIFRYVQPKYNLVFNTIEDLYVPKGGVKLKLMIGLRHLNINRLSRVIFRALILGLWKLLHIFGKKKIHLPAIVTSNHKNPGSIGKMPAGQVII